jgi:hypothetical protein
MFDSTTSQPPDIPLIKPEPIARPAERQQKSTVLNRQQVNRAKTLDSKHSNFKLKLALALVGGVIVTAGGLVALMSISNNRTGLSANVGAGTAKPSLSLPNVSNTLQNINSVGAQSASVTLSPSKPAKTTGGWHP